MQRFTIKSSVQPSARRHLLAMIPALLLTTGVLSLSGCAGSPTQQSTGEYIDDAALVAKVNAALASDSVMSAFSIDVESYRGTVQLSGFLDDEEQIDQAVEIAEGVDGVASVENSLQVKPAS